MEDCTGGHRLLVTTAAALVDPRPLRQALGFAPATANPDIATGPPKSGQVLDAPILRSELRDKLQKPLIRPPMKANMLPRGRVRLRSFMSLPYRERKIPQYTAQDAGYRHEMVFFGARDVIGTSSREGPQLSRTPSTASRAASRHSFDGSRTTHFDPSALPMVYATRRPTKGPDRVSPPGPTGSRQRGCHRRNGLGQPSPFEREAHHLRPREFSARPSGYIPPPPPPPSPPPCSGLMSLFSGE